MKPEKIARINELAKIAKERDLKASELAERAALRAAYIMEWKKSVAATMENVYIENEDGSVEKLKKK